jgi:hypothetical protein
MEENNTFIDLFNKLSKHVTSYRAFIDKKIGEKLNKRLLDLDLIYEIENDHLNLFSRFKCVEKVNGDVTEISYYYDNNTKDGVLILKCAINYDKFTYEFFY